MRTIRRDIIAVFLLTLFLTSCHKQQDYEVNKPVIEQRERKEDEDQEKNSEQSSPVSDDIVVEKQFLYDKYTLDNFYTYNNTEREFQWDQIIDALSKLDSIQQGGNRWGIIKNRRNVNGEAALVKEWERNAYKLVADMYGVERYQSVPLYLNREESAPERYGRDGSLVKILDSDDQWVDMEVIYIGGEWSVPKKYVKILPDSIYFRKIAFVDRTNQNIATLEKVGDRWFARSMNPATTGVHNPPYAHETPLGVFVTQEKKEKMLYLNDGSSTIAGYAPYATRFSNGGYIHGVPTNNVNAAIIEYSPTLGSIPRSHMCVRNASSHAKFVYDWLELESSLVIVIE